MARTWFGEIPSCCSLTLLLGPAWVLLKCVLQTIFSGPVCTKSVQARARTCRRGEMFHLDAAWQIDQAEDSLKVASFLLLYPTSNFHIAEYRAVLCKILCFLERIFARFNARSLAHPISCLPSLLHASRKRVCK